MGVGISITQKELSEVVEHEREVAWRKKRLDELKSNIKALLEANVPVEPGRFDVRLRKCIGRPIPWKKAVIENLGTKFADWFKKQFRTHVYFEVEVVEYAIPPLWRGNEDSGMTGK